jgi:3-hydroxyacyl-[acyl-carrier-protein] dehydratase
MKFVLIDRITELVPGERISAVKALTLAEEYLADHFPTFPVMPGVLIFQTLVEASTWLVRETERFAHSMLLVAEAKNVTYKSFVSPGQTLEVSVEAKAIEPGSSRFVGTGRCGETEIIKAHWSLRHFNLADDDASLADQDRRLIEGARRQMGLLRRA